jgi:hypothetical protein
MNSYPYEIMDLIKSWFHIVLGCNRVPCKARLDTKNPAGKRKTRRPTQGVKAISIRGTSE